MKEVDREGRIRVENLACLCPVGGDLVATDVSTGIWA
jgi:hypothetical protein